MRTLAAIMFTDIEGYTALMQQDEEEALYIRNTHRKYFNEITAAHQGRILQYYGDGTLSIFHSAHAAVQCGIELQQAYREEPFIPVRIGIHLGEIIFNDEEIIGDAVNVASRIESLAGVGSVLISEKVYEEIRNQKNFQTNLLGTFQFKNVFHPMEVHAVVAPGLTVPAKQDLSGKTAETIRWNNLPHYPSNFVGRRYHLDKLRSLLCQDNTRLITLLGPGGIGKTRLSVKLGELLADSFRHGVCFVPLDVVTDPQQTPLYIGHRLGLKESYGSSWIEEIIDCLKDKQLLLILDNLEQILGSTPFIIQILNNCPRVRILVTSRETLGMAQETEYPLDALNLPDSDDAPAEEMLQYDAIDLFVQKAISTVPNFRLTEDKAGDVARICRRLDGLPLPIELAAARIKLFSPAVILKKLENSTEILKTRSNLIPYRYRTIRETIQWSYDLLDASEKELFQQLCLFRGGFTPSSLETIFPELDALEVIESFINKSLIIKDREVQFTPRFSMLKLIRDFGLELLESRAEKDLYYRHFADYFLAFAAEANARLQSSEQAQWIELFDAEYENLMVSLEWLRRKLPGTAPQMGLSLWRYLLNRGLLREGLQLVESLLALPIEDPVIKAGLLEGAGALSHNLGNYLAAKEYFKACLQIWKERQEQPEIAKALNNLGWAEWRIGNYDHAISYSEDALEICRKTGDLQGQARSLNNLAWTFHSRGHYHKAGHIQLEVLQLHKTCENKRGIAFAKTKLAWIFECTGRIAEAELTINESIQVFTELKDQQLTAFSWAVKALILSAKGNRAAAEEALKLHCLPNFRKIGDVYGMAFSDHYLGELYFHKKDYHRARHHLNRSVGLSRDSHHQLGEAQSCLWLGKVGRATNDFSAAEQFLDRALELAAPMEVMPILRDAYLEKAARAFQQRLMEPALLYLTLADYYAGALEDNAYQDFRSTIRDYLSAIQQHFGVINETVAARLSSRWHSDGARLAKPLDKVELQLLIVQLQHGARPGGEEIISARNEAATPGSSATGDSKHVPEDPFLKQVRRIVEKQLPNAGFGVQELCRELGISHSQLHRKLHALSGLSASRFIRSVRLNKAKELLLDPEITVTAVAYDTGFKDPDYFYRVFKQTFDMTPGEFRDGVTGRGGEGERG